MAKRALISVSDKTGAVVFAKELADMGYEIISTGGTAQSVAGRRCRRDWYFGGHGLSRMLGWARKTLHQQYMQGFWQCAATRSICGSLDELASHPLTLWRSTYTPSNNHC